jgi:hypothetical protein
MKQKKGNLKNKNKKNIKKQEKEKNKAWRNGK